ncbi:MAG TPA: hypothetical protein VN706_05135 [Gemmatimonadaceae bacterium]|nr:hypothetical protein [Gemmatimonadaceae bacterium]
MAAENTAWQLEDFVDSLVVDLDKTRETLAVKAINKPLSYTVKELALDLNIFPTYDGDNVRFVTAQPGQEGASKVSIQLGSITDQQVRATSKVPEKTKGPSLDDIAVDKTTKKELRKLGVQSVDDLQRIERKNVDLKKVGNNDIDYRSISNQIQQAQRNDRPPLVRSVSLSREEGEPLALLVRGRHLAVNPQFPPVAVINNSLAEVLSSDEQHVRIALPASHDLSEPADLVLTCDPFAVLKVHVKGEGSSP